MKLDPVLPPDHVCGSTDLDPILCTGGGLAKRIPYVDNVPSTQKAHLRGWPRFRSKTTKCFRNERDIDSNLEDDEAAYSGIKQLAR